MPLERSRLAAGFYLERIRIQVELLRNRQYPGEDSGPSDWLDLVKGIIDTAILHLKESEKQGANEKYLIDKAYELSHLAFNCIDFMRGSDIEELPYPLVPPLSRWFRAFGIDRTIIFRCAHEANFEIRFYSDDDFKRYKYPSPSLTDAVGKIKWPVLRVTVPTKEIGILPHFSIVAHELGHAVYSKTTFGPSGHTPEHVALINDIQAMTSPDLFDLKAVISICDSWFREIAADIFAFLIAGPAFFFSLSFFQIFSSRYGISNDHPPNDLRRRIIFRLLSRNTESFATVFREVTGFALLEDFNSPLILKVPPSKEFFRILTEEYECKRSSAATWVCLIDYLEKTYITMYEQTRAYLLRENPGLLTSA